MTRRQGGLRLFGSCTSEYASQDLIVVDAIQKVKVNVQFLNIETSLAVMASNCIFSPPPSTRR